MTGLTITKTPGVRGTIICHYEVGNESRTELPMPNRELTITETLGVETVEFGGRKLLAVRERVYCRIGHESGIHTYHDEKRVVIPGYLEKSYDDEHGLPTQEVELIYDPSIQQTVAMMKAVAIAMPPWKNDKIIIRALKIVDITHG